MKDIKRGQIYYCDFSPVVGSEQGGLRPCLIIQNDVGNKFSPTTIVAIITTRKTKAKLPTHHWLNKKYGLREESMVECEQLKTIDKQRLKRFVGQVDNNEMAWISERIKLSLAIG